MAKMMVNGKMVSVNADGSLRKPKAKKTVAERRAALQKAAANLAFDSCKMMLESSPNLTGILEGRKNLRKFHREASALADPVECAKIRERLEARLSSLAERSAAATAYLSGPAGKIAADVDNVFVTLGEAAEDFDAENDSADEIVNGILDAEAREMLLNPADPFGAWRQKRAPDAAGNISTALPDNPEEEEEEGNSDE